MSLSSSDQPSPVLPAPVDPTTEIDAVLRSMLDRLFILVATLGVFTFAVNSARVLLWGYNPSYAGDIVAFGALFCVLALRKRLPTRAVFGVVVGAIVMMGLVSLATLGLASAGMMILTTGCILVGVFTSLRTTVITAVTVFVVVALIGLAQRRGLHRGTLVLGHPGHRTSRVRARRSHCRHRRPPAAHALA
jgi:hypothetical protein